MKTIQIQITEVNEIGKREQTLEELAKIIQFALDTVVTKLNTDDIGIITKYKVHVESIEIIMTQEEFDRQKECDLCKIPFISCSCIIM